MRGFIERGTSRSRYKIKCADRRRPALAMLTSDGIYKVVAEFKDSYALHSPPKARSDQELSLSHLVSKGV
jgi:hypothetical protein